MLLAYCSGLDRATRSVLDALAGLTRLVMEAGGTINNLFRLGRRPHDRKKHEYCGKCHHSNEDNLDFSTHATSVTATTVCSNTFGGWKGTRHKCRRR